MKVSDYSPEYKAHLRRQKDYLDPPPERFIVATLPGAPPPRRRMISPEVRRQHDDMGNAPNLMTPIDRLRVFGDRPDFSRAAPACLCTCGREYGDHPAVLGALWLTRLCDDSLVKL
jgi:hypothetical protein